MNTNNLAQKTNFMAGSNDLSVFPFYLTGLNIPGITFSHPEIGGRSGTRLNIHGDSITYNSLSFDILVDEDFKVYHELMGKIKQSINHELGTFKQIEFDFWIQINNSKGNPLFKLEFHNCKIESIGDIQLDSQDEMTEFTMNMELKYDYYDIITTHSVPVLRT